MTGRAFTFAGLLDEVAAFIRRHVVMTAAQVDACAFWVAHTYAIEASDATPYLHVTAATKRAGKTRLLEVLELLVAKPWLTGRVSAAVLPRKVDQEHPTLLLDESDAAFGANPEYSEALRAILNSGYRRSGKSSLCVGQGAKLTYRDFSTFCAKAIAGIGKLPDTVADRSIAVVLRRKTADESVSPFRRRVAEPLAEPLRRRLEEWAGQVTGLRNAEPVPLRALNDRQWEVWEPLLAIAESAGGDWTARARHAATELSGNGEDADPIVELLQDLRAFTDSVDADFFPTKSLVDHLNGLDDRPWATSGRGDKGLTPRGLATRLGPLGIHPHPGPTGQVRGYRRDAFADAFRRYPPEQASTRQGDRQDGPDRPIPKCQDEAANNGNRQGDHLGQSGAPDGLTDQEPRGSAPRTGGDCGGCNSPDCPWCDGPDRDPEGGRR